MGFEGMKLRDSSSLKLKALMSDLNIFDAAACNNEAIELWNLKVLDFKNKDFWGYWFRVQEQSLGVSSFGDSAFKSRMLLLNFLLLQFWGSGISKFSSFSVCVKSSKLLGYESMESWSLISLQSWYCWFLIFSAIFWGWKETLNILFLCFCFIFTGWYIYL